MEGLMSRRIITLACAFVVALFLALFGAVEGGPAENFQKKEGLSDLSTQFNKALRDELLEMKERDQEARLMIRNFKDPNEDLWVIIGEIDDQNGLRLEAIIDQYGWPGVSLVGLEGSSAMLCLVLHQDQNVVFQRQCLEQLEIAVSQQEADLQSLAYLTDRVKRNSRQPQVYGTQWALEDDKICLYEVEDVEHLDERRLQMGLCTFAEYKKQMQLFFNFGDDEFK